MGVAHFVVLGVGNLVIVCGSSNGGGLELKSAASRRQKGEFFFLGQMNAGRHLKQSSATSLNCPF